MKERFFAVWKSRRNESAGTAMLVEIVKDVKVKK